MNATVIASIVIGVLTVAGSAFAAVLSNRTAARASEREQENKSSEIVSEAHQVARAMEAEAVKFLGEQVVRLTATVERLEKDQTTTKEALRASERKVESLESDLVATQRALHASERKVEALDRLLRESGITVPDRLS